VVVVVAIVVVVVAGHVIEEELQQISIPGSNGLSQEEPEVLS